MGQHKIKYPIPNLNLRYVQLPIDPSYIFFEDGSLYSRKNGIWMARANNGRGTDIYMVRDPKTGRSKSFSISAAIRKFFNPDLDQIEGLDHKTIKDFPNYELYSNGKVWSRTHNKFLKGAFNGKNYFVALRNDKGEQTTFYPQKVLEEYFNKE